jgi:hypothetical protein
LKKNLIEGKDACQAYIASEATAMLSPDSPS